MLTDALIMTRKLFSGMESVQQCILYTDIIVWYVDGEKEQDTAHQGNYPFVPTPYLDLSEITKPF